MNLEEIVEDHDLVILDLETTGTNTKEDWIVQFAGVRIFADGRERETLVRLVKPKIPIPEAATAVHHITDEMVASAPTFPELCPEIERFLEGADLGGYNVLSYDLPLLRTEMERCGRRLTLVGRRVVDGMTIFKHFERRDLGSALRFYCGTEHTTAHDALGDVEATIEVIQAQLDRYSSIPKDLIGLDKLSRGNRITPDSEIVWSNDVPCMGFGKHRGTPLQEMVKKHEGYLRWILKSDFSYDVHDVISKALKGVFPTKD
jgi:DNA polymerase-3 subunit epsilon